MLGNYRVAAQFVASRGELNSIEFVLFRRRETSLLILRRFIALLHNSLMTDDDCEAIGGIMIGGKTEVLGENLPQCRCRHHGRRT
jgi:hypothetical protein